MKNRFIIFLSALLIVLSLVTVAYCVDEENQVDTASEAESTTVSTSETTPEPTETTTSTTTETTTTPVTTTTTVPPETTRTTTTTAYHTTGTTVISTIIPPSITTITETDTEILTDTETLLVIDTDEEIVSNNEFAFVTKEQLAAAKELGEDIEVCGKLNDNANYRWLIRAATITDTQSDVNLTISDTSAETIKIGTILPSGSKKSIFNFAFSGNLPFSAEITVEGVDLPNGKYYLYYFNKATASGEYNQDVQVTDGKLVFNISHCSVYFLSDALITKQSSNSGMDSYVKIILEVALAIVAAIILGVIVSRLRSKNEEKMNPPIEEFDDYVPDEDEVESETFTLKVENTDENVFDGTYDGVLMFDEKDEPKDAGYGYGYKPHIDEFYSDEIVTEDGYDSYGEETEPNIDLIIEETDAAVYSDNADLTDLAINEDE